MFLHVLLSAVIVASTVADSMSVKPELIEALMVESLRHNLVQACDNEKITLHCPRNTHILIENVFYGRLVPSTDLCPVPGSTLDQTANEDTTCVVSQAQSRVVELCRNKRKCRIVVKTSFFESDPCPTTTKYLQISYKCKPISFEDQNFCEGSQMQLSCKQNKRLSVYSANYGRLANGQQMSCANNAAGLVDSQPVFQDCVSDVLPQVLQKCHAQTDCTIDVADRFLGSPCPRGVRKYLSLIFMCVNDEVFSEAAVKGNLESMRELEREIEAHRPQLHETPMAKDEPSVFRPTAMQVERYQHAPPHAYTPPDIEAVPGYVDDDIRVHPARQEEFDDERLPNAVGFANDLMTLTDYLRENKEKALLYFFLSVSVGVILLLIACMCQRCRAQQKSSKARGEEAARLQTARSPELSSLIGASTNTSPMFFDSDCHSRMGLDMGEGHYMRFSHVTPPRIPASMHYYT